MCSWQQFGALCVTPVYSSYTKQYEYYNIHKIAYAITIIWYTGYNKYLIQYHLRFYIYINIPQYTPGFAKSVCLMMLCFADFF